MNNVLKDPEVFVNTRTENKVTLKTSDCGLNETLENKLMTQLQHEMALAPESAHVNVEISKNDQDSWQLNLSMKYARGHIATIRENAVLEEVVHRGVADLRNGILLHQLQASVETFHFDKSTEYDYYTELSQEITPAHLKKQLSTLILEDDPAAAIVLQTTLKSLGCTVDHFEIPSDALKAMQEKDYDLIVLDWNLPYMKGSEFLVAADIQMRKGDQQFQPNRLIPVVICTSMPLSEISLPPVPHFYFCNHWHKSLPFSSILSSLDETTKKISAGQLLATA